MEAEVTPMASGSSSTLDSKGCCATCGMDSRWTSRMCVEIYFLCEDCYKRSLDDPELLSAPPEVHHGDHHMSPDVMTSKCDGCGSFPIWNLRWRCKVCFDIDLCEACHGRLDAVDMPPEHSKEHLMIALEVFCTEMLLKLQPSFGKPVDPEWSYQVQYRRASYGFRCERPMSGVKGTIIHTLGNVIEDNRNPILEMEGNTNQSSSFKQALATTQTNWMFDKKHKIFLSHVGAQKDFVEQLYWDLTKIHYFGIFFDKEDSSQNHNTTTIYKEVKPKLMWDGLHVQGKLQMQQLIQEKIQMSGNAIREVHCIWNYLEWKNQGKQPCAMCSTTK